VLNVAALYWTAAILEGEGTFTPRRNGENVYPSVKMSSIDLDTLERLQSYVKRGNINGPYERGNKPYWVWSVSGAPALALMERIDALMSERRQKQIQKVRDAITPDLARHYEGLRVSPFAWPEVL
jgi:hypothetical protein